MKKTWIWIGAIIAIIVIGAISIVVLNKGTSTGKADSVIEKYGDILMKGNYGDIIDIAYFPESELITKEKLEEKKKQYAEEMKKTSNVISFDYVQSTEDDEKISYKVTINGTETQHIDLIKSQNKLLIEDLYDEVERRVFKDSTLLYNGVALTSKIEKSEEQFDYYNLIYLTGLDYEVKITHPYMKDYDWKIEAKYGFKQNYIDHLESDLLTNNSTKLYKEEVEQAIYKIANQNFGVKPDDSVTGSFQYIGNKQIRFHSRLVEGAYYTHEVYAVIEDKGNGNWVLVSKELEEM